MYTIQEQSGEFLLVEVREDDLQPIVLDTMWKDRDRLKSLTGLTIEDNQFEIKELAIEGYPGMFHTIAKLK